MAQEITTNTFTGGMVMDINDLDTTSNTTCVSSLNATVVTYNGNEGAIQNDMGNVKIKEGNLYALLPENSIVLGSAEHGGVIYYVLKINDSIEIGTFPSPNYSASKEVSSKMLLTYNALQVGTKTAYGYTRDVAFRTNFLEYDEFNPVNILIEPSFDGSVNLILNDGKHHPKLINSGFHVQDNGHCKLIKRYGDSNTNRYNLDDKDTFNLQTSLYRNFNKLSKFVYNGTVDGGSLKVGNYVFYAVACDKDGNESDIICESGVISIFIGEDGNPFSVQGGLVNQNSYKGIDLLIQNIDTAYTYIKLYYTRATSLNNLLSETLAYKVDKLYEVKDELCKIIFTGAETLYDIDISDLNTQYFNANSAKALALNQNMLFLANLTQDNGELSLEYEELRKLSLMIYPEVVINDGISFGLDSDYNTTEEGINYYRTLDIYNYTGYHLEEYYRFGIVYIRTDGSLTPVFNTFGYVDTAQRPSEDIINNWTPNTEIRIGDGTINNSGVIKMPKGNNLTDILGIKFSFTGNLPSNYKGYFFVRLKRIPTILALAFSTNVCEESYLPSININLNPNDGLNRKGYLYESFAKGAFRYLDTDELFPKNSTTKATSTYQLTNNYQLRLFTLTDNTYLYLDSLQTNGPVSAAMRSIGAPNKALLQAPTFEEYDYTHLRNAEQVTDNYVCMYFALRENNSITFWQDDSNRDAIYVSIILETITNTNLINTLNGYVWKGYGESDAGFLSYDTLKYNSSVELLYLANVYTPCLERSTKHRYCTQNNGKSQYFKQILSCLLSGHTGEAQLEENDAYLWGFIGCVTNTLNENITTGLSLDTDHILYIKNSDSLDSTIYRVHRIFYSKPSSYTWAAGVNDLYRNMFNYSMDAEPSSVSQGKLQNDPEVPTFNGKYLYTEDTMEDSLRTPRPFKPIEHRSYALFCPEYELNLPYYNTVFTGTDFLYRKITQSKLFEPEFKIKVGTNTYITNRDSRRYKYDETTYVSSDKVNGRSIAVQENISLMLLQVESTEVPDDYWKKASSRYFSTRAGGELEPNFKFVGFPFISHVLAKQYDNEYTKGKLGTKFPFNIVRGIYGPYIGTYISDDADYSNSILNIYSQEVKSSTIVERRINDSSAYFAISDRITVGDKIPICYRGDCYINYYTHRINRNFLDSTSPFNDTIIDYGSFSKPFADRFDVETRSLDTNAKVDSEFNIGDINAILLGSWVTFPIRSTVNTCLRSVDKSNVSERLLCGNDRAFYPLHGIDASGSYKIPESEAFNDGYNKQGSEKYYFNLIQLVYNKVYYKNRIVYSNVLLLSALTNGNRVFLSAHFKDYTDQYGEITKLFSMAGNLLCVCERGIMLIPVNERALAAEGSGGSIFINTSNVLPDNPKIISDTFGSKWVESIVQTPYGIYGVDETNKKIWFTDGNEIKIISDFKIQEFLNNYLFVNSALEIGKCNIKSHYIKHKNDVIFTLYDVNSDNLWNICWNINEECWRTFYSWIPLDSQNIGNNLISLKLNLPELEPNYYLWKHGHSQSIFTADYIYPTNWYGELHPFEFEFIVKDNPSLHKIFDNLQIISNHAEPESFHYEIVGDCYDFKDLKPTAYFRQEKLKLLYSSVTNISYADTSDMLVKYNKENKGRAILFPQYYARLDIPNLIYDDYKQITSESHDYDALTGTELIRYKKLNEYRLCNHVKAVDVEKGLLRGNMRYKEDKWNVQINPINYLVNNEGSWLDNAPFIVLDNIRYHYTSDIRVPVELDNTPILRRWKISSRQEVAVKDKYIKIKIRYSGKDLAIISAINTLYRLSYA